ncbi:hypothetical protein WBP07_20870 (plasmid) [Novosphingobium sp. BL-8A]|uniref:hypothetical protein n=1 Tax=Novosphingobium sp. BL-8A TaxID=3127639 RepID=UPI003757573F
MFQQNDLFASAMPSPSNDLPWLIERIADFSNRPRYAFLILNLIAKAAGPGLSAGPYVIENSQRLPIRDWLCDAMMPLAQRDGRRKAVVEAVRKDLTREGRLSTDPIENDRVLMDAVRNRVLRSGRSNVSRAVSDLVRAGLLRRHYQGFRVDHDNRGAQREAVYTLTDAAATALAR